MKYHWIWENSADSTVGKRLIWTLSKWRKNVAILLATIFTTIGLASFYTPLSLSAQGPNHELRGVWLTNIDSEVLFSQENLRQGIQRLAKLNFNTVYPTVWNWGYTLYPSQVAAEATGDAQRLYPDKLETRQKDPRESAQRDRDMLKELIGLAHERNIHVIPWFEFGFMVPAYSGIVQRHPEWVTQKGNGTKVVMEGAHPRVWLNPFHPEVQQFMVDLITEVVSRYDIDGIQLDDHFGLPVTFGYDPYTVKLYRQENRGKRPPVNPRDPHWMRWRANKMTELMGRIYKNVKSRKPQATVSLSPNPAKFSYNNLLQDWVRWEKRRYIDELVIQVYRCYIALFFVLLKRPELQRAKQHIPVSIGILAGLRTRDVPIKRIQQQVKWARHRKFSGVSFFFYETLWSSQAESLAQRSGVIQSLFTRPVQRSVMKTAKS